MIPFDDREPVGTHDGCSGLTAALRNLSAPARPPTDADRPPPSTFPSTRASREARRYDREKIVRPKYVVVNRDGQITREERHESE